MKQKIAILSYEVFADKDKIELIKSFFKGKYWIEVKENLYRRKYISIFYELKDFEEKKLRISTWTQGSFGLIFAHKRRIVGLIGKPDENDLHNEFEKYMDDIGIGFKESVDYKLGMSQSIYLLIVYSLALLLGVVLYIVLT